MVATESKSPLLGGTLVCIACAHRDPHGLVAAPKKGESLDPTAYRQGPEG